MSDRTDAIMRRVRALCPNYGEIESEVAALETDLFQHAAEVQRLRNEIPYAEECRAALKALADKLRECEPYIASMFFMTYTNRGAEYSGPNYGKELAEADRVLSRESEIGLPSAELRALAAKVVAMPKPTDEEIIAGGVAFIMGPGDDEGTRQRIPAVGHLKPGLEYAVAFLRENGFEKSALALEHCTVRRMAAAAGEPLDFH